MWSLVRNKLRITETEVIPYYPKHERVEILYQKPHLSITSEHKMKSRNTKSVRIQSLLVLDTREDSWVTEDEYKGVFRAL